MNRPATLEGWQVWQVLRAAGGQLRTIGTMVIGLDFGAVLALGAGLGACPSTLAAVLADVEGTIVAKINERLRGIEHG